MNETVSYVGVVALEGLGQEKCSIGITIAETIGNLNLEKIIPTDFEAGLDSAMIYNLYTRELAAFLGNEGWIIIENIGEQK